jgi:predicted RNA-binding Zn-ribbon protein involved in translation (DUF1610 family)
MGAIEFTCPNCDTLYTVDERFKEAVDKQLELGHCKFCERKNPDVPTTAEMDGLKTPEDMRNRFKIMKQCFGCSKWTRQDTRKDDQPCHNCGGMEFDNGFAKSLRTFNPMTDGKRKVKSRKK